MTERLPFIDWMKTLGMLVIIYGHAPAGGPVGFTEPFNPKQLGVAFFIFVLGFSLAREKRPPARVLFNRLFDVYLWGIAAALVMSALVYATKGDLAESNYLPFFFGVNVLFNSFPANQTTWYIGLYLHLLLFWALLSRHWRIVPWVLGVAVIAEVVIRAAIVSTGADFVAYMLLTNWLTVFLLGAWFGQREGSGRSDRKGFLLYLAALIVLLLLWPGFASRFDPLPDFPFNFLQVGAGNVSWLLTSASVTFLYLAHTWLVFELTSRLGDVALVRFFSRNTLFVFIVHLPLVRVLTPLYYDHVASSSIRVLINLLIFFVGLSLLSELLRRVVPTRRLRDYLATLLFGRGVVAAEDSGR